MSDQDSGASQKPPLPRWVKISAVVAAIILVVVVVKALAGGDHGPGRHLPGRDDPVHTPPVEHAT